MITILPQVVQQSDGTIPEQQNCPSTLKVSSRGVWWEWLSVFPFLPISVSFNPIPIMIPMPAKHLFSFSIFSHINFPIPDYITLTTIALAVWLSGNALASMNVVALRQTRLVSGWVTVCGRVYHLGM